MELLRARIFIVFVAECFGGELTVRQTLRKIQNCVSAVQEGYEPSSVASLLYTQQEHAQLAKKEVILAAAAVQQRKLQ